MSSRCPSSLHSSSSRTVASSAAWRAGRQGGRSQNSSGRISRLDTGPGNGTDLAGLPAAHTHQTSPKGVHHGRDHQPQASFSSTSSETSCTSSETLADKTLPKLIGEVQDAEFKQGLEKHLARDASACERTSSRSSSSLGEEPKAEPCLGFEGLKKEHAKLIEETSTSLVDLVDLGAAARTENYEIAAYEALRRMAKGLGEEKAVELLDANLQQEKEALREVEKIATRISNESAKELASA